jgi:hypothetical protein
MSYIKASLTNWAQVEQYFKDNAPKNTAFPTGNPYWSLYEGEEIGKKRMSQNWHESDVDKSLELLKKNLKGYETGGGTFYLTLSDKGRDNAPTSQRLINFNPHQSIATINGVSTGVAGIGEILALHTEKSKHEFKVMMLERDLQEAKKAKSGIGAVLGQIPNLDVNNLVNQIGAIIQLGMSRGYVTAGIPPPQYKTSLPPVQEAETIETQEQAQSVTEYTYNTEDLLVGLEKIRTRLKGISPELLVQKAGEMIETAPEFQLNILLGAMKIEYNYQNHTYKIIEDAKV